jgi:hypothetical protein
MDTSTITIIVSVIAAVTSLVSLMLTITSTLHKEIRDENRKRIAPLLEDLGTHLYGMIAAITLLYKDPSIKNQKYWNHQIVIAQKKLRELRSKLRYPLWGFDDAIKILILLPNLARLSPKQELSEVITLATDLRVSMDHVIRKCFKYGRTPGFFERQRVKYRVKKLINKWEDLKAFEQEDVPAAVKPVAKKNLDKIVTTVVAVRESDFDTRDENGNIYTIQKRSKVDSKSSRHLLAGTQVCLFKRDFDRDFHYSFFRKDLTTDRLPENGTK